MREHVRPFLEHLASFVAPGLVLLLLGIQVALGLRGFDRAAESVFAALQVPGVLLGWGGVVLLLPLLIWMVLDWWGYNLGGFALRGLGSAVLGVASAGAFGLLAGPPQGGLIGGGLADILQATVGPIIGAIVLFLMAAPAAVLAFSLGRRRSAEEEAALESASPASGGLLRHFFGRFFGSKAEPVRQRWYPQTRYDTDGRELPMQFAAARDVGGVRFADDPEPAIALATDAAEPDGLPPASLPPASLPPASQAAELAQTESVAMNARSGTGSGAGTDAAELTPSIADLLSGEERLPTIPELLAGNRSLSAGGTVRDLSGGPRERAHDDAEDGPVHVDSEGRLVRTAVARTPEPAPEGGIQPA
ncbi:MAG: hypothetical protein O2894_09070, partial [Planctomycetota bacterium]|nr:hypothetical protein [Planctomycetota bacterium]